MKRPSYRMAIQWLADNDDNEWLKDERPVASVATSLVADLFGVSDDRVTADLRRAIAKAKGKARLEDFQNS